MSEIVIIVILVVAALLNVVAIGLCFRAKGN